MNEVEYGTWLKTIRARGANIPKRRLEIHVKGRKEPFRIFLSDNIKHLDLVKTQ